MKLTADTITDEQIRELIEAARGVDVQTYRIAQTALDDGDARRLAAEIVRNWTMPVSIGQAKLLAHAVLGEYREARARCAEIWNAHHAKDGAE